MVAVASCHVLDGTRVPELHRARCRTYAKALEAAPSYLELLNTTFALVPAGRQPASYRLNEVLAASAIPVFVSGDPATSSPYVPPFDGVVPWESIAFHFLFDQDWTCIYYFQDVCNLFYFLFLVFREENGLLGVQQLHLQIPIPFQLPIYNNKNKVLIQLFFLF